MAKLKKTLLFFKNYKSLTPTFKSVWLVKKIKTNPVQDTYELENSQVMN